MFDPLVVSGKVTHKQHQELGVGTAYAIDASHFPALVSVEWPVLRARGVYSADELENDETDAPPSSPSPSPSPIADRLAEALREIQVAQGKDWNKFAIDGIIETALADYEKSKGDAQATGYDLVAHIERQREWSGKTFGPGVRTAGVIDHIRKELREIEAEPFDLEEWIDVVILALDGAWRAGHEPETIAESLCAKQATNMARQWPDWRTSPRDKAIEHVREEASKAGKGEKT